MSDPRTEVQHGLEGVVAFDTQIAEPDKEGSALRYRGVDIEDLVGRVPFENVWGLLVDGAFTPGLPPAEPFPLPVHTIPVTCAWTCSPRWRCSHPPGDCGRSTTSTTYRRGRTSHAQR